MLVLSRNRFERVFITMANGELIVVEVVEIRRDGKVRLGFEAPANCAIHREEVADRIADQARLNRQQEDADADRDR